MKKNFILLKNHLIPKILKEHNIDEDNNKDF